MKVVVGTAAGGGADILTRIVAEHIRRVNGATLVVENRPGASNAIATETVLRAAPDGRTVLIVSNSFLINPNLKRANYDPLTSF
jgi:tripartite-type tricarboxylate transporter receptor subunit TctC